MSPVKSIARRGALQLRIEPELRGLIDRAAKLRGKRRSDFILDAAGQAAKEVLFGQALSGARQEAHAEFVARLDRPAAPSARLKETLEAPAPWRRG